MPNLRIVSKLTTDVVTYRYCTEASNQKSKYAYYRKIFFYKKALVILLVKVKVKVNVNLYRASSWTPKALKATKKKDTK